jgi:hypothetical protein
MRRPTAALLASLVILISQSARATNHYYNKFEALCEFKILERCSHRTLFSPDLAYADAGGDRTTDEVAPRSAHAAHQSKHKLARGGPLHVYRSSADKIEHPAAQPAQRKKK